MKCRIVDNIIQDNTWIEVSIAATSYIGLH